MAEATACWELKETDEYMLNMMLKDSSATLDVYGACGNMYGVQYADSKPLKFVRSKTNLQLYMSKTRLLLLFWS